MSESVVMDLVKAESKDAEEVDDSVLSSSKKRKLTSKVWDHFDKIHAADGVHAICRYCCMQLPGKSNYGTTQLWRHLKGKCPNFTLDHDIETEVNESRKALLVGDDPIMSSFQKKKLTSKIWEHFDRLDSKNGTYAKCHHCHKVLPGDRKGDKSQGTNPLWRHVDGKCPNFKLEKGKGTDLRRQVIKHPKKKNYGLIVYDDTKFNQERSRQDLAEAVILHEYPFSLVDHFAFQKFIKNLQPQFKVVNQQTIVSECMKIYETEERRVRSMLDKVHCRISLSCSLWTSFHDIGYLTLAAHFVDNEWKLQRRIINFCKIESQYVGECISKAILTKLSEWNIDKKLFSIVLDNCDATDMAVKEIQQFLMPGVLPLSGELFHVHCCSHVINLIVHDCLDSMSTILHKMRESIKYVKASSERQETFKLYAQQLNAPKNSSVLDVPKRWDTTYKMLGAVLKCKEVFCCLASVDDQYSCLPSADEWENARTVYECLVPLFELAEFLSRTSHPTSNVYFTMICELKVQLKEWCNSENVLRSAISCKILEFFEVYWNNSYRVLALASILDPRLKMKPIEFYFPMIYGEDLGQEKILDVRSCLATLCDEYQYVMRQVTEETKPIDGSQTSDVTVAYGGTTSGEVSSLTTAWSDRMKRLSKYLEETSLPQSTKSELDLYLEEVMISLKENFATDFDVLSWWKTMGSKYPVLAYIAMDLLSIPLSAVTSEAVFNTGERVIDPYRSCMSAEIIQSLICTQDWLRSNYETQALANPDAFSTMYPIYVEHVNGQYDLKSIAESIIQ